MADVNNSEKNKDKQSKSSKIVDFLSGGAFANGLSILLIAGSLLAIIWVVNGHLDSLSKNRDIYNQIINPDQQQKGTFTTAKLEEVLESFQIFYRESNAANTNILSILLPVFGAWVGAIIAFYYGNKNFEKLSQGYKEAVNAISTSIDDSKKLSLLTAENALAKHSEYKEVKQAKISDQVGKSFTEIGTTFLLKDNADKPLGFIYSEDILKSNIAETELKTNTQTFEEFISQTSIIDEITGKKWTTSGLEDEHKNKLKNYIELNLNDTLLTARDKMKVLSDKQKVRCLVLDNQRQIKGIITYELIAKAQSEEIEEKMSK